MRPRASPSSGTMGCEEGPDGPDAAAAGDGGGAETGAADAPLFSFSAWCALPRRACAAVAFPIACAASRPPHALPGSAHVLSARARARACAAGGSRSTTLAWPRHCRCNAVASACPDPHPNSCCTRCPRQPPLAWATALLLLDSQNLTRAPLAGGWAGGRRQVCRLVGRLPDRPCAWCGPHPLLLCFPRSPRCIPLTVLPSAALGLDFERIRDFQLGCVDRTHGSLVGAFSLRQYVDEIMVSPLPLSRPLSQPPVCPRLSPPHLPSLVRPHASSRVLARALFAGLHATRRRILEDWRPRGGEPHSARRIPGCGTPRCTILSAWSHSRACLTHTHTHTHIARAKTGVDLDVSCVQQPPHSSIPRQCAPAAGDSRQLLHGTAVRHALQNGWRDDL